MALKCQTITRKVAKNNSEAKPFSTKMILNHSIHNFLDWYEIWATQTRLITMFNFLLLKCLSITDNFLDCYENLAIKNRLVWSTFTNF